MFRGAVPPADRAAAEHLAARSPEVAWARTRRIGVDNIDAGRELYTATATP